MNHGTTKFLEVRRHAKRHAPLANLTNEGIARVKQASACNRSYAHVVTSPIPRAIQTAVAMGHAVDEEDWTLGSMGALVGESIIFDAGFAAIQHAIRTDRTAGLYAELQALQLRHHLTQVEPGESVLVVSHGGIAEAGVIGLLPDVDLSGFGPSLDYCEGARLEFVDDRCTRIQVLRFDGEREVEGPVLAWEPGNN
jgi:broad specificity phosphatase PhoE